MYCCGLRCKEARTLARQNVHLDRGYLDVLQSKGPKSRRVYISQELTEYLAGYDSRISRLFPDRTFFFPNRKGRPYGACWLERNFLRFWYAAFPEKKDSGISIRAYDLRHHFVYANMNRWLREGKDVNAMLPYLMRYMGHSEIKNTLYYFHLVPDIYGGILEMSGHSEGLIPEVDDGREE
ncbi:tyrosine-type recombinase/integrase [Blautia sp. RD014234]|nr:tyrosine-type recombinase/integrase [Blautia parvula]